MSDVRQIPIPGRCAACGRRGWEALTLHTTHDQDPGEEPDDAIAWYAHDGDLVTCPCGARYVCRDLGEGRIEVVPEARKGGE